MCGPECTSISIYSMLYKSGQCDIYSSLTHHTDELALSKLSLSSALCVNVSRSFSRQTCQCLMLSVWAWAQNSKRTNFCDSLRGDKRWTEKLNNRLSKSEYKQKNMTSLSWRSRGVEDVCVWRENKADGTSVKRQQSTDVVMGHLSTGKGWKFLLCNVKKSAQQMCWEVNLFSFLSRWCQVFHQFLMSKLLP